MFTKGPKPSSWSRETHISDDNTLVPLESCYIHEHESNIWHNSSVTGVPPIKSRTLIVMPRICVKIDKWKVIINITFDKQLWNRDVTM